MPLVIFLNESKRKTSEIEWLRLRWKFEKCFIVECVGKESGLGILWMEEVKVEIISFSRYHIDVRVGKNGGTKEWRFNGFYGDLETNRCHQS